jgi:meiotically up-regulated gene 157 (Mug157) protein
LLNFKAKVKNKNWVGFSKTVFPIHWTQRLILKWSNNKPDTYVITGDIDAMWLRDSTAQVWPYLLLIKKDKETAAIDCRSYSPASQMHNKGSLCERFLQR